MSFRSTGIGSFLTEALGTIPSPDRVDPLKDGSTERVSVPINRDVHSNISGFSAVFLESAAIDFGTESCASFDLLRANTGRIVAVFPVIEFNQLTPESKIAYLDLSPYTLSQGIDDANFGESWTELLKSHAKDQELIQSYLQRLTCSGSSYMPINQGTPYVYVQLNPETGRRRTFDVSLSCSDILSVMEQVRDLENFSEEILIPVFPTVYRPNAQKDPGFYSTICKYLTKNPNQKVLVVGPGSGIDTWVAQVRSEAQMFAIGLNPFEVANVQATAFLAHFPIRAIKGNNIASSDGSSRFVDEEFDWVLWDMPWHDPVKWNSQLTYAGVKTLWECNGDSDTLQIFSKGLKNTLLPQTGKAIVWNSPMSPLYRREIQECLRSGGERLRSESGQIHSNLDKFKLTEPYREIYLIEQL